MLRQRVNENYYIALLFRSAIFIVTILVFPGCRQASKHVVKHEGDEQLQLSAQELQARLVDIPFPLDAVIKNGVSVAGKKGLEWVASCTTQLTIQELKIMYHRDMEQLGWREIIIFAGDHHNQILLFEKPNKVCIIEVKQRSKSRSVTYHIAPL